MQPQHLIHTRAFSICVCVLAGCVLSDAAPVPATLSLEHTSTQFSRQHIWFPNVKAIPTFPKIPSFAPTITLMEAYYVPRHRDPEARPPDWRNATQDWLSGIEAGAVTGGLWIQKTFLPLLETDLSLQSKWTLGNMVTTCWGHGDWESANANQPRESDRSSVSAETGRAGQGAPSPWQGQSET